MKQDRNAQSSAVSRIVKAILAVGLLLGLLGGSIPLELVSASASCKLACCVGKTSHAAGSCAGDSCPMGHHPVAIAARSEVRNQTALSDPLCGADHVRSKTRHRRKAAIGSNAATRTDFSVPATNQPANLKAASNETIAANAFKAACNRDCGCCAQANLRTRRGRELAILPSAHRPPPPANYRIALKGKVAFGESEAVRNSIQPRGPPTLLS